MEQVVLTTVVTTQAIERRAQRSRFYAYASALLLALTLAGFAKSFFLKAIFGTPALPIQVHVHGILMTGWFVLLLIQTGLIGRGRVALHRQIGVAGVGLAACIVTVTIFAAVRAVPRLEAAGLDPVFFTFTGLGGTLLFGGWVTAAIWWRTRPEVHRPLMLFATLQLVTAAIGRIELVVEDGLTRIVLVQSCFVAALVVRDVLARRRPHPVILIGGAGLLASSPLLTWLSSTALGPTVLRWVS
jgi:hypothetical protein